MLNFVSSKRLRNSIKAIPKATSTPSRQELSKIIDAQWRPRTCPQVPWTLLDPNVWSHQHLVPCLSHPPPGRVRKTCPMPGKLCLSRIWSNLMKLILKTSVNNSKCYSKCKDKSEAVSHWFTTKRKMMNEQKTDSCTTKAKIQLYCLEKKTKITTKLPSKIPSCSSIFEKTKI